MIEPARIARNHARRLYMYATQSAVPDVAEHLRLAARLQARAARGLALWEQAANGACIGAECWEWNGSLVLDSDGLRLEFNDACDGDEVAHG